MVRFLPPDQLLGAMRYCAVSSNVFYRVPHMSSQLYALKQI
jgi:hypothetical protein